MAEDLTAKGHELNQYLALGLRERQSLELVMWRLQPSCIQTKMGKDSMGVMRVENTGRQNDYRLSKN